MNMKQKRKANVNRKIGIVMLLVSIGVIGLWGIRTINRLMGEKPEDLIVKYMDHIEKQEYDAMYSMIDTDSSYIDGREEYIERNSKIYEGIEVNNLKLSNIAVKKKNGKRVWVTYETSFDTIAGQVHFENEAEFTDTKDGYRILWRDSLIFPELSETDKVQVSVSQAERGQILDRNGKVLAGKGAASSVGIVPGKLENKENAIKSLADLLEMDAETIENKLTASWIKDDSFVPIATIPKVQEIDLMSVQPDEEILKEYERQKQLLIPGVMMTDVEIRSYSLGEAAAHLIGYVQAVTA